MSSSLERHDNEKCPDCNLPVPAELRPYFDCLFIHFFSICAGDCREELNFSSKHAEGCNARWIDESRAMKEAGWVVPVYGTTYCGKCAQRLGIKHDSSASSDAHLAWWNMNLAFPTTQNQIIGVAVAIAALAYGFFFFMPGR